MTLPSSPREPELLHELAASLHTSAIRMLRTLRIHDIEAGTTAARLSVLSLLVHAGIDRVTEVARAEQVSMPTVSRMVRGMEAEGLVRRAPCRGDARAVRLIPTRRGKQVIARAQAARLSDLEQRLSRLTDSELRALRRCAPILKKVVAKDGAA